MEQLTLEADGGAALAVRVARPAVDRQSGLALVYLHGFLSSQGGEKAASFRERAGAAGLPFVSFDLQGHGDSGGSLLELTFSRCLDDLRRVRAWAAAQGWDRLVLFGSSLGGAVAMWSAALDPTGIAAGVHVAPALELERRILDGLSEEEVEAWRREGRRAFDHELGRAEVGWGFVEDLRRYESARLRALTKTPTLILQGTQDDAVPWHCAVDFLATCLCPEVELHLFGDGDHRLLAQRPVLWRLAESFLVARGILGAPA